MTQTHDEKINRHIEDAKRMGETLDMREDPIDLMGWRPTCYVLALEVERLRRLAANRTELVYVGFNLQEFADTLKNARTPDEIREIQETWRNPSSTSVLKAQDELGAWMLAQVDKAITDNPDTSGIIVQRRVFHALKSHIDPVCERIAYHTGALGYHPSLGIQFTLGQGPRCGVALVVERSCCATTCPEPSFG